LAQMSFGANEWFMGANVERRTFTEWLLNK